MLNQLEKQVLISKYSTSKECVQHVLSYCHNKFEHMPWHTIPTVISTENATIKRWETYNQSINDGEAFEFLKSRIVQFMFPISAGISTTEAYRKAALRGILPNLTLPNQT